MKCEILRTTEEGQEVAGVVTLENGVVTISPDDSPLLYGVLQARTTKNGTDHFWAKTNPKEWFEALPYTYSGSYVRARIL